MLTGQGKLSWGAVKSAWGKAWGAVFGSRPASHKTGTKPDTDHLMGHKADQVIPANEMIASGSKPREPINWGEAAGNILAFFTGLLAWVVKNPIAAAALAILILWLVVGASCSSPFGFGKSKGELRLERELAEREAQMQETLRARDEAIAAIRQDTARTLQQIRLESQRGHDAIAAATPEHEEPIDPHLVAAWRDALDGLCVARADGTRADSCGP